MFGRFGMQELIIILAVALLVFGPTKLPEIGKSIGKAIGEFKGHAKSISDDITDDDSKK
ncbi:twin-arginine translocase TatA/TatE family subunit [Proteinivorax hydrogeniformans]|uniref:Sec-independent protein translocase protein TatA n=1 Tax=Proteinivorax hydrogeniformans TaxID=1826727 RepID=A0AAU8HS52_9FIRM